MHILTYINIVKFSYLRNIYIHIQRYIHTYILCHKYLLTMRLRKVLYIAQDDSRCDGLVVSQADERLVHLVLAHDGFQTAQSLYSVRKSVK